MLFLPGCLYACQKTLRQHPSGIILSIAILLLAIPIFFFLSTFLEIDLSRAEVNHINSCTEARAQRAGTTHLHS